MLSIVIYILNFYFTCRTSHCLYMNYDHDSFPKLVIPILFLENAIIYFIFFICNKSSFRFFV